jgi:adenosylcobinamide-GDP ribazoletransferase
LWTDGLRLALTTFTVAPVAGPKRFGRAVAGRAMLFAPAIGALLGLVAGGLSWVLRELGVPALMAGALAAGLLALLTRGLHLDGLADTVDALGSYRSRDKALEIMKSPETGAFGVAALALVILLQSTAFGLVTVLGAVTAVMTGRLAITLACRPGMPPARPDGLGALVAGTASWAGIAVNVVATFAVSWFASAGRPWQGPAAVAAALIGSTVLLAHLKNRLGGITGDVLGFLAEAATTIVLIGLCFGAG